MCEPNQGNHNSASLLTVHLTHIDCLPPSAKTAPIEKKGDKEKQSVVAKLVFFVLELMSDELGSAKRQ